MSFQRYSWDQNEKVYFEIEPEQLEPGLKRVKVEIVDNVTGQDASAETVLWVVEDAKTGRDSDVESRSK